MYFSTEKFHEKNYTLDVDVKNASPFKAVNTEMHEMGGLLHC